MGETVNRCTEIQPNPFLIELTPFTGIMLSCCHLRSILAHLGSLPPRPTALTAAAGDFLLLAGISSLGSGPSPSDIVILGSVWVTGGPVGTHLLEVDGNQQGESVGSLSQMHL